MIKKMLVPIFPLNGVILFPKTNLPLNIFKYYSSKSKNERSVN